MSAAKKPRSYRDRCRGCTGRSARSLRSVEVRSQLEVAKIMGVSRQAVDFIERRALAKIRRALRQYRDYLIGKGEW